ncbi:MAG: methyltransferase domain-containing protein, partial [Xanthomonadaceae bacterium]|nr:methyltransferase domain-containing protein [Xanthomonadaceae bacterium]
VYTSKAADAVSWYQAQPRISLDLIAATKLPLDAPLIDVGGGASLLVDRLLTQGRNPLSVLDISATALASARARLGADAAKVRWIEADVREFAPAQRYDLWHDRAVFHFLTDPADRAAYMAALRRSLNPRGHVVMATFALDGPARCSGLDVAHYDAASLHAEFGADFEMRESRREIHLTPTGAEQRFTWVHLRLR